MGNNNSCGVGGRSVSGATEAEINKGSAINGKFNNRVEMPDHVYSQQLPNGAHPGNKFLKSTPSGVATLVTEKGAKELYMNLKVELCMEAGGQESAGWSFSAIHEIVQRSEDDFAAKGIRVTFCLVSYWVWSPSEGETVAYRHWLEFANLSRASRSARAPKDAYRATMDYTHPPRMDAPADFGGDATG